MNPSAPRALPRPIRILSDDLTGALDTAAMLAASGPIPVRLDRPSETDDAPVSVVSTGTRDVDPASLAARLAPSMPWLRAAAVPFRKVDSLLRGNSIAEVAATARGAGSQRVLFAPAFPAQGRFTVGARLLLGEPYRPDGASPAAGSPPLLEAFGAFGMEALAGAAALDALAGTRPGTSGTRRGPLVLIPDVRTDGELEALVERALALSDRILWCGSAGLAQALARLDAVTPAAPPAGIWTAPAGPGLLVTASRHAALRGQLARLREAVSSSGGSEGCGDSDDSRRSEGSGDSDGPRRSEGSGRSAGGDGDAHTHDSVEPVDLAPTDPRTPEAAAAFLASGAARLVATHPRPAWLAVIGGDTLLALCRAAGVEALSAGPAPRPGWGRATLSGGAWDGLTCLTRSGAFGAPDDLLWLARTARPGPTLEHTTR